MMKSPEEERAGYRYYDNQPCEFTCVGIQKRINLIDPAPERFIRLCIIYALSFILYNKKKRASTKKYVFCVQNVFFYLSP